MQVLKVIGLALGLALIGAAGAWADDLSGVWQGVYWGGDNQATAFQTTLRDTPGPAIEGSTVEINNFGDQQAPFLLATLSGEVQGDQITFTKSYDGTGSVSHAVTYRGRLVSDRRIVGTWSIGKTSGAFEMAR